MIESKRVPEGKFKCEFCSKGIPRTAWVDSEKRHYCSMLCAAKYVSREAAKNVKMGLPKHFARHNPSYLDRLVKEFGSTEDPNKGGFILPDGNFLDLSEGSGSRSQDHRAIAYTAMKGSKARREVDTGTRWNALVAVAKRAGLIRWMPESFTVNIFTKPTRAQVKRLVDLAIVGGMTIETEGEDLACYTQDEADNIEKDLARIWSSSRKNPRKRVISGPQNGDYDTGYEVTPGGGVQRHGTPEGKVTPRVLHGDSFKERMGVCMEPGCVKIAGHEGEHTRRKNPAKAPKDTLALFVFKEGTSTALVLVDESLLDKKNWAEGVDEAIIGMVTLLPKTDKSVTVYQAAAASGWGPLVYKMTQAITGSRKLTTVADKMTQDARDMWEVFVERGEAKRVTASRGKSYVMTSDFSEIKPAVEKARQRAWAISRRLAKEYGLLDDEVEVAVAEGAQRLFDRLYK